jgi:PIN domain nuclease of toxin-antitoxin system
MAIKQKTGKINFAMSFDTFIEQQLNVNSIDLLNISLRHKTPWEVWKPRGF